MAKGGRRGREEGARGKMGFYDAPFPSFHPPIPPIVPPFTRRAGGRVFMTATTRAGEELVYTTTTPVRRAEEERRRGDTTVFASFLWTLVLCLPRVCTERDLWPIRAATPLVASMARRGISVPQLDFNPLTGVTSCIG